MKIDWDSMSAGENKLLLSGEAGNIECILHLPDEGIESCKIKAMMICCHPHPLYGGTMTNKVVHIMAKTFCRLGLAVLRFNFRGIGLSDGKHDEGKGESDDLLALSEIMKQSWPDSPLWLAGFSFGSWVAANSANRVGAEQLLSIAPPVQHFDFDSLGSPDCPWLVVMGEEDEIVDPAGVFEWIDDRENKPKLIRFSDTGHFFHGQIVNLSKALEHHYRPILVGS